MSSKTGTRAFRLDNKFLVNFAIFLTANLLGSYFSHIDDTDETFGYWEPLHYLLFGTGMQTWEYAPQYAIRTYAFISPFWCFGALLKLLGATKILTFYAIRVLLGTSCAYAEACFIDGIDYRFGPSLARYSLLFALFSPGILYASTSFLPSAVSMTLVLLAYAGWMKREYNATIFYGCTSVLWTGWPFVGLVFLPLGIHMIWSTYIFAESKFNKMALLIGAGVCILMSSLLGAAIIDIWMYQRITSPTLNILLYNAIGGNGDELYGVEPPSYYVRNLFLNLGLAWPLGVAAPILLGRAFLEGDTLLKAAIGKQKHPHGAASTSKDAAVLYFVDPEKEERRPLVDLATIFSSAVLWLAILFKRPHKEERFMYPIYPLLAVMAAFSLVSIIDIFGNIFAAIIREPAPTAIIIADLEREDEQERQLTLLNARSQTTQSPSSLSTTNNADSDVSGTVSGEGGAQRESAGTMRRRAAAAAIASTTAAVSKGVTGEEHNKNREETKVNTSTWAFSLKILAIAACIVVNLLLHLLRVMSNYNNFGGYISLWSEIGTKIITPGYDSSRTIEPVRVCMGGEWYTFPSHFFLPEGSQLEFVYDTFHGELPQYFSKEKGTSAAPLQPFNDQNREEVSRYVPVEACDFIVTVMKPASAASSDHGFLGHALIRQEQSSSSSSAGPPIHTPELPKNFPAYEARKYLKPKRFKKILSAPIIDPSRSRSAIARAYAIPGVSTVENKYNEYSLYVGEAVGSIPR